MLVNPFLPRASQTMIQDFLNLVDALPLRDEDEINLSEVSRDSFVIVCVTKNRYVLEVSAPDKWTAYLYAAEEDYPRTEGEPLNGYIGEIRFHPKLKVGYDLLFEEISAIERIKIFRGPITRLRAVKW